MSGGYYLRAVEEADRELLFEWANDGETRRESFSQAPITWEEHAAWFARTQADEACRHWILMVPGGRQERMAQGRGAGTETVAAEENAERTDSGQTPAAAYPAGVLRLKRDEESGAYCLSYSIAPAYRGHGYGTVLLVLAKTWMIAECPDCVEVYGEVKAGNAASVRCFERAGYERAGYERAADETAADQSVFRFYADMTRESVLYFRADGGGGTGIGHLMRCYTIADACREKGLQAVFVAADEGAEAMTLERGYPCRVLNTDYRDMNSELPKLIPVLRDCAPVVLDSYFLTEQYVNALRESGHPVVWMDDLAEQEFSVDIRVNYNLYAERPEEESDYSGKADGCLDLLGPSYAPVRPSFLRTGTFVRERIGKVLVLTGGSDPLGAGLFFACLLTKQLPDAEIFVVIGPYAEGKEALRAYAEQEKKVELMEGCSDLSDVMRRCDLAVTAAGSTLYELCASGLPGIVYYIADNQRMGAEAFARRTGAVNLGDFRSDSFRAEAEKKLEAALRGLYTESGRQNLAKRMKELVDGHGAVRIAEKLKELAEKYET